MRYVTMLAAPYCVTAALEPTNTSAQVATTNLRFTIPANVNVGRTLDITVSADAPTVARVRSTATVVVVPP